MPNIQAQIFCLHRSGKTAKRMPQLGQRPFITMWLGDSNGNKRFLRRNCPYFIQTYLYLWGNSHSNREQFPTIIHFWIKRMLENFCLWGSSASVCSFLAESVQHWEIPASSWASWDCSCFGMYSPHLRKLIHSPSLPCHLLLFLYSYRYGSSRKTIWETQVSASYAYYKSEFPLPPFLSCKILPT